MDFELSEDQKLLAETVASFSKTESTLERARRLREDERGWEPAMWKKMADLGWQSVPFPENVGGFGGNFVDMALVLENLAPTLVPEPFLPSVVLGGMAILHGGSEGQQSKWLPPMIEGKTSLAFAHSEVDGRRGTNEIETRATKDGDGWLLSGTKVWVLGGNAADHWVVSAVVDGDVGLFVVDANATGAKVTLSKTIDGRRAAQLVLEKAPAERLEAGSAGVIERVLDYGAAATVAEGMGLVQTMLDMTVEYLKTREQFGTKIGAFQVLQHRAVDMFIEVQLCRSMVALACVAADDVDAKSRAAAISAAKVQLATGGRLVAQQAIQLHGGVGVTDEHDIGLFFKRLYALNMLFGDEAFHLDRFAHHS